MFLVNFFYLISSVRTKNYPITNFVLTSSTSYCKAQGRSKVWQHLKRVYCSKTLDRCNKRKEVHDDVVIENLPRVGRICKVLSRLEHKIFREVNHNPWMTKSIDIVCRKCEPNYGNAFLRRVGLKGHRPTRTPLLRATHLKHRLTFANQYI